MFYRLYFNFSGFKNTGDDLLLVLSILLNREEHVYVTNMSFRFYNSIHFKMLKKHGVTFQVLSPIQVILYFVLRRINYVKLCGGQVFQDFKNYLLAMPIKIFWMACACKMFNVPFHISRVGFSELSSCFSAWIIGRAVSMSASLSVRDAYSAQIVKKLFNLDPLIKKDYVLDYCFKYLFKYISCKRQIAMKSIYYSRQIAVCIFAKKLDCDSFSRIDCDWYKMVNSDWLPSKNMYVNNFLNTELIECINKLQNYRWVITNRLHFAILAYTATVPNIILIHRNSHKLMAFAEYSNSIMVSGVDEAILALTD